MAYPKKVFDGSRWGSWLVIRSVDKRRSLCLCDCGTKREVQTSRLSSGLSKSCGCKRGDHNRTHGMTRTRVYRIYNAMLTRCNNDKSSAYPAYGGRGITVCDRWMNFENFLSDMGAPPDGCSIDRIDNDGNYEPKNCKWSTVKEQNRNTRRTKLNPKIIEKIRSGELSKDQVIELTGAHKNTFWAAKSGQNWKDSNDKNT